MFPRPRWRRRLFLWAFEQGLWSRCPVYNSLVWGMLVSLALVLAACFWVSFNARRQPVRGPAAISISQCPR